MPIYEYQCHQCERQFELLIRSETNLICPYCQSDQLNKKLSIFSANTKSTSINSDCAGPCQGNPIACQVNGPMCQ